MKIGPFLNFKRIFQSKLSHFQWRWCVVNYLQMNPKWNRNQTKVRLKVVKREIGKKSDNFFTKIVFGKTSFYKVCDASRMQASKIAILIWYEFSHWPWTGSKFEFFLKSKCTPVYIPCWLLRRKVSLAINSSTFKRGWKSPLMVFQLNFLNAKSDAIIICGQKNEAFIVINCIVSGFFLTAAWFALQFWKLKEKNGDK